MGRLFTRWSIIVLIFTLVLSAAGCNNTASSSGNGQYSNSEYGFTVNYPKEWALVEKTGDTIVAFNGPVLEETGGKVSINIISEKLSDPRNTTLDDYLKAADSQLAEGFENYKKISTSDLTVSGIPARKMIYSFNTQNVTLQANQVYFIQNDLAYCITFVATPGAYNKYIPDSDMVINSFKLN